MAKVLLDTNIILDYLSATRPKHRDAVMLLESSFEDPDFDVVLPSSSIKDAYYILCRMYRDEAIIRDRLSAFCGLFEVAELTVPIMNSAFASDEPDFEDGIVRAMAEVLKAEAIITRDADAFSRCSIPSMDARAFLWR